MAGDLRPGRARAAAAVQRAAFCTFVGKSGVVAGIRDPQEIARRLYPRDGTTLAVVRADVSPASTTTASGLADMAAPGVSFLSSLAPLSVAARLMAGGIEVQLAGVNSLNFPRRSTGPVALAWVLEGEAIPLADRVIATTTIGPPAKLALICTFTRELARRASAEQVFDTILREDAAVGLDAVMLSATDGAGAHPDGLFKGVTPIAGYPGGDVVAMRRDLRALLGSIAAAGATTPVIVCAPEQAAAIAVEMPEFRVPIWPSLGVAPGTVAAVDAGALVFAIGDVDIDAANAATLHMSDAPAEIVSGAPATADPVMSLFQADAIALRLIIDVAFALRAPGLIAFATGISW